MVFPSLIYKRYSEVRCAHFGWFGMVYIPVYFEYAQLVGTKTVYIYTSGDQHIVLGHAFEPEL